MSGTVYLKIEKNVQIRSRSVYLKDIAQIVSDDSALENRIRVLKLPADTVQGPGRSDPERNSGSHSQQRRGNGFYPDL